MRRLLVLLAIAAVAACAGGRGDSALPTTSQPRSSQLVQKTITLLVPAYTKSKSLRSQYVSRNTQGVGISFGVSPATFPTNTTPTAAFDVSATSALCTLGASGARTCTLTVGVPVGTIDLQVTAWDSVPVSGAFPATANALSTVTLLSQTIASGTNTPIGLTLNGIATSVNTTVAPQSIAAYASPGPSTPVTVSVNALDASGNVIMGNGSYVDASGNALTISVSSQVTSNGGTLETTPTAAQTVTPASPTFTVNYVGGSTWGTTFVTNVADAGGSFPGTVTNATLNVTPTIQTYPLPSPTTMFQIATGPDGNLWFSEYNGLGKVVPAPTPVVSQQPLPAGQNFVQGITTGPDGNLWYADCSGNMLRTWNTTTNSPGSSFSTSPGTAPDGLISGPGSKLWFSEFTFASSGGTIGEMTTAGAETQFSATSGGPLPTGAQFVSVATGSDGNVWFAENCNSSIQYLNPTTGALSSAITVPAAGGSLAESVASGPGGMWYAAQGGPNSYVGYVPIPGGSSSIDYTVPAYVGQVFSIVQGSDNAMWFTGKSGAIGRVTQSGTMTIYVNGLSASDDISAITLGPDGNLWFVENYGGKVGRLVY